MSGASELIDRIFDWGDKVRNDPELQKYPPSALVYMCAKDVERVVSTAWHPVSEPPTEVDGDSPRGGGDVIARWEDGLVSTEGWNDVAELAFGGITHWARINDVLLLPPA